MFRRSFSIFYLSCTSYVGGIFCYRVLSQWDDGWAPKEAQTLLGAGLAFGLIVAGVFLFTYWKARRDYPESQGTPDLLRVDPTFWNRFIQNPSIPYKGRTIVFKPKPDGGLEGWLPQRWQRKSLLTELRPIGRDGESLVVKIKSKSVFGMYIHGTASEIIVHHHLKEAFKAG